MRLNAVENEAESLRLSALNSFVAAMVFHPSTNILRRYFWKAVDAIWLLVRMSPSRCTSMSSVSSSDKKGKRGGAKGQERVSEE